LEQHIMALVGDRATVEMSVELPKTRYKVDFMYVL
jgi:hypothetical protein